VIVSGNNQKFLKNIHPDKVIIISFAIWLGLFIVSPLKVNIELNWAAYLFVLFSFLSFFAGGFIYNSQKKKKAKPGIELNAYVAKQYRKIFNYLIAIASIGLLLKLVDRFALRGISIDADFGTNREIMEAAGGNPIGILASFLAPFCYFPLFYLFKYKFKIGVFKKFLVYFLFIGQIFDSLLLSSRSAIFINIVFLLLYLLYFKKIKITVKSTFRFGLVALAFIALMSYIYLERTKTFAGDNAYDLILYSSNFNFSITSNNSFLEYFNAASSSLKAILVTYITTVQYFVHGMFEFSYVYDNFNEANHSFGQYTFVTYYRFLSIISGTQFNVNNLLALSPRVGVYTTLLGPLYIDFGWFNLIFMFLAGFSVRRIYHKAMMGVDWAVVMYFYFFIVLAFWPVFNFINGAGGIFILTSIVLLSFITKIKPQKNL
jgi:hypothetical protein